MGPVISQDFPEPAAFGLPAKFQTWRQDQMKAILTAIHSPKRFVVQAMPTGSGKSLCYIAQALMTGARTVILTSTKALQEQLENDFSAVGLTDIRGQGNYDCIALWPGGEYYQTRLDPRMRRCDWGPCHAGADCALKRGGCHYFDALALAKRSQLVVTNYSYWMAIHRFGEGLGERDLLILDESHSAPDELSSFLSVELEALEIEGLLGTFLPTFEHLHNWKDWAVGEMDRVNERMEDLKREHRDLKELRELRLLARKLSQIAGLEGLWVVDRIGRKMRFDPVWPAPYAESCLFREIPKVVLFSATIRPKTCEILGIPPDELDFLDYSATFPRERRPVYAIPTVRVTHRTDSTQMRVWVDRMDQIIERRLDRKGLIHTVSYARRNYFLEHSRFRDLLWVHSPDNTAAVVRKFKSASAPCVLVSPALATGYDFPYQECEYAVIGKIAFIDSRVKVTKARIQEDPDYSAYIAMQTLVQSSGRGMRAVDDQCEVLVIDDNLGWAVKKHRTFLPPWFLESIRHVKTIPDPPPPLTGP